MSDSQCGCICCPNKSNGEIIAAQVLSMVAWVTVFYPVYDSVFFGGLSWFEFGVLWVSFTLMIVYQVLWCVSIQKKLHWALIIPTIAISCCNFYSAIVWATWIDGLHSLFYWVPAVLWLVAAILQLVFVFKKSEVKVGTEDADNVDAGEDV